MKLYVDKSQCKHYVKVKYDAAYLETFDNVAQFESHKLKARGCYGTIYLRPRAQLMVVAHEIVHAAMHFVNCYTNRRKYNRMSEVEQDEYVQEATAYTVEGMLKQYMIEVGMIRGRKDNFPRYSIKT
jgi:uncharacterized protein YxeA